MTPEPAPTLSQLLAFYLEAGVDCALSEEPVDRLSDSRPTEIKAASVAGEAITARVLRSAPAPVAPASDPLPAPDAAIATAREAARTASSLEILREMLEKFDGCALK